MDRLQKLQQMHEKAAACEQSGPHKDCVGTKRDGKGRIYRFHIQQAKAFKETINRVGSKMGDMRLAQDMINNANTVSEIKQHLGRIAHLLGEDFKVLSQNSPTDLKAVPPYIDLVLLDLMKPDRLTYLSLICAFLLDFLALLLAIIGSIANRSGAVVEDTDQKISRVVDELLTTASTCFPGGNMRVAEIFRHIAMRLGSLVEQPSIDGSLENDEREFLSVLQAWSIVRFDKGRLFSRVPADELCSLRSRLSQVTAELVFELNELNEYRREDC